MGIIYESDVVKAGQWWVEARTKSIQMSTSNDEIEIDYDDLDNFEKAIKFAQKVRRDKEGASDE